MALNCSDCIATVGQEPIYPFCHIPFPIHVKKSKVPPGTVETEEFSLKAPTSDGHLQTPRPMSLETV